MRWEFSINGCRYKIMHLKWWMRMCYRIWKQPKASKCDFLIFFATLRSSSVQCSGRCGHRPGHQVQPGKRGDWGLSLADRHPGECSSHCCCLKIFFWPSSGTFYPHNTGTSLLEKWAASFLFCLPNSSLILTSLYENPVVCSFLCCWLFKHS